MDLGAIAKIYALNFINADQWLETPDARLGETVEPKQVTRQLFVEITASRDAALTLRDVQTGDEEI